MSGRCNVPSSYIIFRKGSLVLFLKRSHTGYMDGLYGLPSGHVEDMESFSVAGAREVFEETGLQISPDTLRQVHTMHRNCGDHVRVDAFFESDKWVGEPINAEPNKHSEIVWLNINNLPKNTVDYIRFAIEQINAGNTYSEFGWSDAKPVP